jgi:hypothetical protein
MSHFNFSCVKLFSYLEDQNLRSSWGLDLYNVPTGFGEYFPFSSSSKVFHEQHFLRSELG